ncbi:Asp-tRNA(Asn)/Glu-tRNA(Gln) amidotransferase subunit GatC [bacterium]|nr:Asp-tRNA(Asn)/Glu-tRNA(Gln) amidotransferase subunit GatC [bacterium]
MKLDKKQIKHIASLSKLELTDKELEKYGNQLSDVLGYIDQLKEVDVSDTIPTAQVTGLENVLEEDVVRDWDNKEIDLALNQAPELDGREVKVKRVLE